VRSAFWPEDEHAELARLEASAGPTAPQDYEDDPTETDLSAADPAARETDAERAMQARVQELMDGLGRGGVGRRVHRQTVGDDEYTARCIELLETDDFRRVIEAVTALGDLGTPRALSALISTLDHRSPEVRAAALTALRPRYRREMRVHVERRLQDAFPRVRAAALETLVASGDRHAVSALVVSIRAPSFQCRHRREQEALLDALAALDEGRWLAQLERIVFDRTLSRDRGGTARLVAVLRASVAWRGEAVRPLVERCAAARGLPLAVRSAARAALRRGL